MGLDINAVQFLIAAHKRDAKFGDVLTLGRQDLNVFPSKMCKLLRSHGLPDEAFRPNAPDSRFAEPVFKALGATHVVSMDASDFENAMFIHDLNIPIGTELKGRFGTVYDGGTLEHVFNFPVALQNCMEMVKCGGNLFVHTCANNWCGHGFYQFSPELFYRTLCPENGFAVERMILHMVGPYGRWYEVADPQKIRSRVELITVCPVQLLVHAKRIRLSPVFTTTPQQSDFVPRWQPVPGAADPPPPATGQIMYGAPRPKLARSFPGLARLLNVLKVGAGLLRTHTIANRKSFRQVKKGT